MTESSDYESVQVFIGVDVGKDTHHAVAINRSGKRLFDKALPNDENKLRSLISGLKQHGQILLVVDQPATIGALPVAVARSEGVLVGYLPGLAVRRIADLHAGEAKTDARDAAIIAEAARTGKRLVRTVLIFTESSDQLSRATDRVPGLPPVLDMFNDVAQPLFWLHIVQTACADQRVQHRRMFTTAVGTREHPLFPAYPAAPTPRKAFSAMLLSISTQPLLQYTFSASHCFSRYANAFAVSE